MGTASYTVRYRYYCIKIIAIGDSKKYVFRYDSGLEREVVSQLLDMIFDDRVDFGWSDAALISFDVIEGLVREREFSHDLQAVDLY